jgi:hypothetical protein
MGFGSGAIVIFYTVGIGHLLSYLLYHKTGYLLFYCAAVILMVLFTFSGGATGALGGVIGF